MENSEIVQLKQEIQINDQRMKDLWSKINDAGMILSDLEREHHDIKKENEKKRQAIRLITKRIKNDKLEKDQEILKQHNTKKIGYF